MKRTHLHNSLSTSRRLRRSGERGCMRVVGSSPPRSCFLRSSSVRPLRLSRPFFRLLQQMEGPSQTHISSSDVRDTSDCQQFLFEPPKSAKSEVSWSHELTSQTHSNLQHVFFDLFSASALFECPRMRFKPIRRLLGVTRIKIERRVEDSRKEVGGLSCRGIQHPIQILFKVHRQKLVNFVRCS